MTFCRTAMVLGVVASGFGGIAHGAVIDLNTPNAAFTGATLTPVVTSRVKFDMGGGVDQMLFKQPNPAGFPGVDVLRGNSTNLMSATYAFTLVHSAADRKFTYSLTNGSLTGGASFANANSANSTTTYTYAAGELNFNILHVFALGMNQSTVSYSNASFSTGAGLSTTGTLPTSGSVTNGAYDQWLYSPVGTNLADYDWTFSANVTLQMNGVRANNEALKFEFTGKSGAAIPEPSSLSVAGVAGLGLLRRRR